MVEPSLTREASLEALAAEVGPMAFSVAYRMLGDRSAAEDALQDAYFQAYRAIGGFRGEASMKTWFMKILVNCCRKHRRVWRKWTSLQSDRASQLPENVVDESAGPGDPGLRDRLDAALKTLTHRQRMAFVLRYTQEMPIADIAEIMDCAPGTVKATIHKAVQKLRVELGDLSGGFEDGF